MTTLCRGVLGGVVALVLTLWCRCVAHELDVLLVERNVTVVMHAGRYVKVQCDLTKCFDNATICSEHTFYNESKNLAVIFSQQIKSKGRNSYKVCEDGLFRNCVTAACSHLSDVPIFQENSAAKDRQLVNRSDLIQIKEKNCYMKFRFEANGKNCTEQEENCEDTELACKEQSGMKSECTMLNCTMNDDDDLEKLRAKFANVSVCTNASGGVLRPVPTSSCAAARPAQTGFHCFGCPDGTVSLEEALLPSNLTVTWLLNRSLCASGAVPRDPLIGVALSLRWNDSSVSVNESEVLADLRVLVAERRPERGVHRLQISPAPAARRQRRAAAPSLDVNVAVNVTSMNATEFREVAGWMGDVQTDADGWSPQLAVDGVAPEVEAVQLPVTCAGGYGQAGYFCRTCEAGSSSVGGLGATCEPCEQGRYQPEVGRSECEWCEEGATTASTGSATAGTCSVECAGNPEQPGCRRPEQQTPSEKSGSRDRKLPQILLIVGVSVLLLAIAGVVCCYCCCSSGSDEDKLSAGNTEAFPALSRELRRQNVAKRMSNRMSRYVPWSQQRSMAELRPDLSNHYESSNYHRNYEF